MAKMAKTGDSTYAAEKAGYHQPVLRGSQLMARPAIKAEVLQRAEQILHSELLPLALEQHRLLLTEAATPAGTRLGAVKLTYDETRGRALEQGRPDKEPSEMTYEELQASIESLRREQEARADNAVDVTPGSAESDVFG